MDLKIEKHEALRKHWDEHQCGHTDKELRERQIRGGSIQYVYQCLRCGGAVGNAISKTKAHELCNGPAQKFDQELVENWKEQSEGGAKKIIGKFESEGEFWRAEFFKWYAEYLKSEEWKFKRAKVIKRANGLCEGCLNKGAKHVHHLTYRNVEEEFLFQLVALCEPCHDRFHHGRKIENEI